MNAPWTAKVYLSEDAEVTGNLKGADINCSGNIKAAKNISAFDVVLGGRGCTEDFAIAGLECPGA